MGRTAFVFSGGGAKGSFELGGADYLIRAKQIDPEVIVGVSTGNLNAAMLAQGKGYSGLLEKLDRLRDLWLGLENNGDVYRRRILGLAGLVLKADSIYSNERLWKLIREYVCPIELRNSGRLLRIGIVGLKSGDYFVVDGTYDRILEMIRASSAIPVFFNPVDLENERFVDGGVRNVTPLNAAFQALGELAEQEPAPADSSLDTIYVILASPLRANMVRDEEKLDGGIEIGMRSLELLINEVYANDLQLALTINESLAYLKKVREASAPLPEGYPFEGYRYVNIVVIQPEKLYMDSLEFDPAKIRAAYEAGKEAARVAVEKAEVMGGSNVTREIYSKATVVLRG